MLVGISESVPAEARLPRVLSSQVLSSCRHENCAPILVFNYSYSNFFS